MAGPVLVAQKLIEAVAEGRCTPLEANRLCGHLILRVVGGRRGSGVSQSTMYAYEKRAREIGIAVADNVIEEVEVDLGGILEQALDTGAWDHHG